MSASTPQQALLIPLETALHRLVEGFWEEPYRYFTERDAVTALQTWVATRPALAQAYQTTDGFETGLLHREYPTPFRLDDKDPTRRGGGGGLTAGGTMTWPSSARPPFRGTMPKR